MCIEERILNDSGCSAYVDTNRKYVEIAFKDGAYWGYEQGCKDMIDKACEWLKENTNKYIVDIGSRYETKLIVGGKCWEDFRKAMED